jgi:hypothetical protein
MIIPPQGLRSSRLRYDRSDLSCHREGEYSRFAYRPRVLRLFGRIAWGVVVAIGPDFMFYNSDAWTACA